MKLSDNVSVLTTTGDWVQLHEDNVWQLSCWNAPASTMDCLHRVVYMALAGGPAQGEKGGVISEDRGVCVSDGSPKYPSCSMS